MKVYAIHGNGQDKRIYKNVNYEGFTPLNLPGHGDEIRLDSYGPTEYIEFLIPKITEDCILVGHSLGGHLALELAKQLPQVKGCVCIASPPISNNNFAQAFLPNPNLGTLYIESPTESQFKAFCKDQSSTTEDFELILDMIKKQDPVARVTLAQAMAQGVEDELEKVNSLKIPYYFLIGNEDNFVNIEYVNSLKLEHFFQVKSGHNIILEKPNELIKTLDKIKAEL